LEGVVANEQDKQMAFMRANSVPNVFSVENHLRVQS
jgi:osmotically-inducible protein OsmY